jgi:hypothetical protein
MSNFELLCDSEGITAAVLKLLNRESGIHTAHLMTMTRNEVDINNNKTIWRMKHTKSVNSQWNEKPAVQAERIHQ